MRDRIRAGMAANHRYYQGTRTALMEAGLVEPGDFPGDPGRPKTTVCYAADGSEIRSRQLAPGQQNRRIWRSGSRFKLFMYDDCAPNDRARAELRASGVTGDVIRRRTEFAEDAARNYATTGERKWLDIIQGAHVIDFVFVEHRMENVSPAEVRFFLSGAMRRAASDEVPRRAA